ncbi:LIM domain transcription factor LMO4 isoform X1 [Tachysurus ichikawai]
MMTNGSRSQLFGNSGACSACGQSIPASELVMRAQGNVYHLKCFTCSTCRNRLVPGDRFHYINGSLFCEHDRPTALMNGHLSSLQTNPLLPDQKVNTGYTTSLINTNRTDWIALCHDSSMKQRT